MKKKEGKVITKSRKVIKMTTRKLIKFTTVKFTNELTRNNILWE